MTNKLEINVEEIMNVIETELGLFDPEYNRLEKHFNRLLKEQNKNTNKDVFEYFTAVPDFGTNISSNEIKEEGKETVSVKPSLKSQLQNFDVVEIRGGNFYLVCIDKGIFINLETTGYNKINHYNEDLTYNDNDVWDVVKIYRTNCYYLLPYITKFRKNKDEFNQIYQRVDVKTHTYTKERLKEILGISSNDMLVVED